MAKPYREGKTWSVRLRLQGQDIYRSGFATEAKARQALDEIRRSLEDAGKAFGLGPFRTPLGVALSDYARQRLPHLKGARQDANRINRYLRPLGLPVIELTPVDTPATASAYWTVNFVREAERSIPASLAAHRTQLDQESNRSASQRARLAKMLMADITTHDIQQLIDAMKAEGKSAATIALEQAELRRLFSHARRVWHWGSPLRNPATELDCPQVDNARDRVLTNDEWLKMSRALSEYGNPYVAPLLCLMLETAMRSCEPLTYARWGHVNWTRRVLELPDAKAGKRNVPLSPGALVILGELATRAGRYAPDDRIFPTTYEAVKKAWSTCRAACGIEDAYIHDLRHTAATRYSLEYQGNLPVIMLITGHKTVQMAMRYINLKADDVVQMMHGGPQDIGAAPAGYQRSVLSSLPMYGQDPTVTVPETETGSSSPAKNNVVHVDFRRHAA